ncbi:MAG TPA: hypothetical protein VLC79_12910 [Cellvibrio sp.]|nr:hypothetical protein [Cellvibrio sp.]
MSGLSHTNPTRYTIKSAVTFAGVLFALTAPLAAHASLLDCSKTRVSAVNEEACATVELVASTRPLVVAKEAIPAAVPTADTAITGFQAGFQVGQLQPSSSLHGSTLLIGLICALLGVVLFRTKNGNSK